MLLVGHLGKEKTVRGVLQRYYCRKTLVSVVKLCGTCQYKAGGDGPVGQA